MIKGVYKEFITVKIKSNPIYDEAIFILKRPYKGKRKEKSDMAFEANRILCEEGIKQPKKRRRLLRRLAFSSGFTLFGAIIGGAITFFLLK